MWFPSNKLNKSNISFVNITFSAKKVVLLCLKTLPRHNPPSRGPCVLCVDCGPWAQPQTGASSGPGKWNDPPQQFVLNLPREGRLHTRGTSGFALRFFSISRCEGGPDTGLRLWCQCVGPGGGRAVTLGPLAGVPP